MKRTLLRLAGLLIAVMLVLSGCNLIGTDRMMELDQMMAAAKDKFSGVVANYDGGEANDDFIWQVCHLSEQEGWNELPLPSLYPLKHRELLRAIVAVRTGISYWRINLTALDKAYSIAYPNSTPINKSKKVKK